MNINDVVSDTVHQFAPTYHSYVLYSNSGARNAPKTVRTKEVFVLPEAPNKFHDNANLLANMELGVHSSDGQQRTMSDQDEGSAQQHARDDALYRVNTFSDVDDEFRTGPLEEDEVRLAQATCTALPQEHVLGVTIMPCKEVMLSSTPRDEHTNMHRVSNMQEGIELSSADVNLQQHRHSVGEDKSIQRKGMLQRQTTDEFLPSDTALDIDEVSTATTASSSQQTPEERMKQFKLAKGWSDVALQDEK